LLDAHVEEHGEFSDIEMIEARDLLYGERRQVGQSESREELVA
jgi:hypothetical protein